MKTKTQIIIFIAVVAFLSTVFLNAVFAQQCKGLRIGKTYIVYGVKIDPKDPFEKQPKATVTIVNIKKGYIQYCWNKEYKSKNRMLFSRSCEDFLWLLRNKKQD